MVSALYAAFLTFLVLHLLIKVSQKRRKHKVSLGEGTPRDIALQRAIRAHGNAVETIPLFLILLGFLEYNGAPTLLIHLFGIIFTIARLMHAHALPQGKRSLPKRILSIKITLSTLGLLAALNLAFLPFSQLI